MRTVFLLLLSWSLAMTLHAQVFPVDTILNSGLPEKKIKFVFLSDGYQADELPLYLNQVKAMKDVFFTQTPFKEYKNFFNLYAVRVPSVQSGADHPGTASDEVPGQPITTVNTYFNSTFDFGSIHRLVVAQNVSAIYNVLIDNFPTYDQAFILVNSPYYGGSGGTFAAATTDASSAEIAIHEIGHSFADLADEYAIDGQGEAPNRTANTNPATVKWKNWLGYNGVGIYPVGVGGWQRPHEACKMQYLGFPFCAVCAESFVNSIYALVTPIYSSLPVSATVPVSAPTTFSAVLTLPEPNTLATEWDLNGNTVATDVDSVTIAPAQLDAGSNLLTVFVTDKTPLSRSYLPNAGYVFSRTWQLSKEMSAAPMPGKPDKFYYQISPNPTRGPLIVQGNADYALDLTMEVYGENGGLVERRELENTTGFRQEIDLSGRADGAYLVLLRLPNGYTVKERIIKAE